MAEKLLNTRILLKYDSYENWITNNPVLKQGEVAIATIPSGAGLDKIDDKNLPNVMLKVGDGTTPYQQLKFVSGLAADVYEWAKQSTKPTYTADEIEGLSDYISGEIQDTDTQYTLVKDADKAYTYKLMSRAKGATEYANLVATIDMSDVQTRLATLEASVGEGGSVNDQITAAISALENAGQTCGDGEVISKVTQKNGVVAVEKKTLAAADIPELAQSKITNLTTDLAGKQDKLAIADAYNAESNKVATVATVTNAVSGLAKADTAVANEFVTSVSQENGVIAISRSKISVKNLDGGIAISDVTDLQSTLDGKQNKLDIADEYNAGTNPVATVATITKMVADLNGAMHFEGTVTGDTFEAAIAAAIEGGAAYEAGDVVLYGYDEYVYDGENWHILGNESIYYTKADAETKHQSQDAEIENLKTSKQDKLVFATAYNAENNKAATAKDVTDAVAALVKADAAVTGQFVTAVSEENGVISVSRAALGVSDIPELPQSKVTGLVDTLAGVQTKLEIADGYDADTNKVATVKTVTNAIGALEKDDTIVETSYVSGVSQKNGVITVERAALEKGKGIGKNLADIAFSGNVNDLVQTAGDVLVFSCGSSSTNI